MHRPMPSDDLSDKAESENEDEEDELKGTALDDYQPSDPGELELQKGTCDTIALSLFVFRVLLSMCGLLYR